MSFVPWPNDPGLPASTLSLAAPLGGQNGQNVSGKPNVTLTSQDNPIVNALQLGVDTLAANLKEQHITSQRATDLGPGANITINPGGAIGNNQTGGNLRLASGASTGNVAGGFIAFTISPAGAAGNAVNGFVDRFYMTDVAGFSVFYPAAVNNGYLGLASNPFIQAYITNLAILANATGAGAAALGANCPAVTPGAPYTWLKMASSDGSTVYVPAWK